ncbi:hypothetical protein BDC45DRAFT_507392 [Circinella umbellata]|nr:hypothetical protein BDC45DRAFT_507392 [Circinella umbellata]
MIMVFSLCLYIYIYIYIYIYTFCSDGLKWVRLKESRFFFLLLLLGYLLACLFHLIPLLCLPKQMKKDAHVSHEIPFVNRPSSRIKLMPPTFLWIIHIIKEKKNDCYLIFMKMNKKL